VNDTSLIPKTLGELLGQGTKRRVYAHPERDDLVVKILKKSKRRDREFVSRLANQREKEMFDALEGRDEQQWLARVYAVSENGVMSVQERLEPVTKPPEDYPHWLAEAKQAWHWGLSRDGNIKQCDFESIEQRECFAKEFGIEIP
jgi:hypothetical protein